MNLKNIFTLVLVSGLFLISCKNSDNKSDESSTDQQQTEQKSTFDTSNLVGSWVEQSGKALHFTLYADGSAQSDNSATLLYQKWNVKDNQLSLVSKSIGNRISSLDTTIYEIQKLNESEMILKRGDLILEYKKANKSSEMPGHKPKVLSGKLTIGHEVSSFKPCGSDKTFWVSDKTGELKKSYEALTAGAKPYTAIYAEIEIIDKGKASEGFPSEYESVYEAVKILRTTKLSDSSCN
jgi:hypothetical protein